MCGGAQDVYHAVLEYEKKREVRDICIHVSFMNALYTYYYCI